MGKKLFFGVFIFAAVFSVIGIYSIHTQDTILPYTHENIVGLMLTIVFLQSIYLYFTKDKSRVYADIEQIRGMKDTKSIKSAIRLNDVAGLEEVKEEVMEIIDFIKNADKYQKMGAKIPKGILLYGPPGTGKTLLASALAGETSAGFLVASGSEFIEKYVGVGAKRIRELFAKARKRAPCIIFIDEIDTIGGKRSSSDGQSEGNQTINQLLTEMDGFKQEKEEKIVIVMGATNRLDILDPALLRPGRFDKHIYIGNPNRIAREQILKVHTRNKPLCKDVDLASIAIKTHGLSGAHISGIVNEAAILAVRRNQSMIMQEDFDDAIERVIAGLKMKHSTVSERERRIVAYHEAGHALVGKILNTHAIEKISIIPTGQALGYVLNGTVKDQFLYTKKELMGKIQALLGGRAAEEVIFGEVTTGAKDDLDKATEIVFAMVCEYGMSSLGKSTLRDAAFHGNIKQIHKEVNKVIDECYKATFNLMQENKETLRAVAELLLEQETITGETLNKLLGEHCKAS